MEQLADRPAGDADGLLASIPSADALTVGIEYSNAPTSYGGDPACAMCDPATPAFDVWRSRYAKSLALGSLGSSVFAVLHSVAP